MSLEQTQYLVYSREKNKTHGHIVNGGQPVLAVSAQAACEKVARKQRLRLGRLFARSVVQEQLEEKAARQRELDKMVNPPPVISEVLHES